MENEGSRRIWSRPIENYNVRYTSFCGDGDSKAHQTVKNIYGDVEVEKYEC